MIITIQCWWGPLGAMLGPFGGNLASFGRQEQVIEAILKDNLPLFQPKMTWIPQNY